MSTIKSILLLVALAVGNVYAQEMGRMTMQCNEQPTPAIDEQLAMINADPAKMDSKHLECIFSYMDGLSKGKDQRATASIARYLDVHNPRSAAEHPIGSGNWFGGEFPAVQYIMQYRQLAIPVLIDTIKREAGLTLKAKNAVAALMLIEAPDPPTGVSMLANEARKTQGSSSQSLTEAARFAVDSWQCRQLQSECRNALSPSSHF
jgi:hypothetical protein